MGGESGGGLVTADARDPVRDIDAWATGDGRPAALDVLRSARVQREAYVGPWLPEPFVEPGDGPGADPAERDSLDERVSFALMVVLETLSPAERTAWVLHDLFGMPFPTSPRPSGAPGSGAPARGPSPGPRHRRRLPDRGRPQPAAPRGRRVHGGSGRRGPTTLMATAVPGSSSPRTRPPCSSPR
jgi:hypothetical protein